MSPRERPPKGFSRVHALLVEEGLLLEADARLPSVTLAIAGEPIRGSWWGHARGPEIYSVACALSEHEDVLTTKLVNGKITFVHRRLWSAVWSIASSGEAWQTRSLSPEARKLLGQVRRQGQVTATGKAVAELEGRLLAHATSVHTASGAHAKVVESWAHWRKAAGFRPRELGVATAKGRLEHIATGWARATTTRIRLPWL